MLRFSDALVFVVLSACSAASNGTDDSAGGGGVANADTGASGASDSTAVKQMSSNDGGGSQGGAGGGTLVTGTSGAAGAGLSRGPTDAGHDALGAKEEAGFGDSGLGGTANDYDPCPKKGTPCAVMPVGDSITLGLCGWTGYRGPLFHLANQDGKLLTYVGSLLDGPDTVDDKPFPQQHEGHSGYTIDGGGQRGSIKALITGVMDQYKPNIVLLMIGTNDVALSLADSPAHLGLLLDTILGDNPNVLLVVAEIVPETDDVANERIKAYNAAIPALVQTRAAAGKHIVMVDMFTPFVQTPDYKTVLMCDDLHPRGPGYDVMAATWYAAIGPVLK